MVLALAIVLATIVTYWPTTSAGYIWDDDSYLTQNELLRTSAGLFEQWIPGNTPQYYPAVFTMFWVEYQLWGDAPAGYHWINILLHALNAILVWRLGRALRIPGAWWLGAVFALHPVHVESVAWITERKNVLSGCFYLASALAYLRFLDLRSPRARLAEADSGGRPWRWYGLALGLFLFALLSKTVTCSLPAALILMMAWQRRSLDRKTWLPLIPLFALGLALAMHTAYLEQSEVGAVGEDFAFSVAERVLIASKALLFYPQKLLVPHPLIFIYPRWELETSSMIAFWPTLLLGILAIGLIVAYRRGIRGPALALAFFAGSLFPALGFFNVYPMRYSFVADHFQYLASLGVLALAVAGVVRAVERFSVPRSMPLFGGGLVLGALALASLRQGAMYADEETLWKATLQRNPGAWIAHNNLAWAASERGEHEIALERLKEALRHTDSNPAREQLRFNIAVSLSKLGRFDEALKEYRSLHEQHGKYALQVALSLERMRRGIEAESYFRLAVEAESDPDSLDRQLEVRLRFGQFLSRQRRFREALEQFQAYAEQRPTEIHGLMFRNDTLADLGRFDEAIAKANEALVLARAHSEEIAASIRRRIEMYRTGAAAQKR